MLGPHLICPGCALTAQCLCAHSAAGCAHLPARRHCAALQPAARGRARCLHLRQVSLGQRSAAPNRGDAPQAVLAWPVSVAPLHYAARVCRTLHCPLPHPQHPTPTNCRACRYKSMSELPEGAVVGSASLRRQAQILAKYPTLKVRMLCTRVTVGIYPLECLLVIGAWIQGRQPVRPGFEASNLAKQSALWQSDPSLAAQLPNPCCICPTSPHRWSTSAATCRRGCASCRRASATARCWRWLASSGCPWKTRPPPSSPLVRTLTEMAML